MDQNTPHKRRLDQIITRRVGQTSGSSFSSLGRMISNNLSLLEQPYDQTTTTMPSVTNTSGSERCRGKMDRNLRKICIRLRALPKRTRMALTLGLVSLCVLIAVDRATTTTMSSSKWARMMYEDTDIMIDERKSNIRGANTNAPPLPQKERIERPRDLHIAFVGDSVTRYMYIDLVYFLRHGKWVQDEEFPNILNAKHYPSWNEHYNASNLALYPNEQCDCYRNNPNNASHIDKETTIENRYFSDPHRNNYATFIEVFGGYNAHGHWAPEDIYKKHGLNFDDDKQELFVWRYDWPGLIRAYLAKLEPKPEYLVFNEGLWVEHELGNAKVRQSIKDALDDTGIVGIYKTTTLPNINSGLAKRSAGVVFNRHDDAMCDLIGLCLDFTWTKDLGDDHYWDGVHFKPHVNRGMNLELLDFLENLKRQKTVSDAITPRA